MYSLNIFIDAEGQEVTYRTCGAKLPDKCIYQDFNGVSVTVCNCDTDNCNKDHECDCSFSPTTQATTQDWDKTTWTTQATTKTTSSLPRLKCQQCEGRYGQCSSASDNGESVTCREYEDACVYQSISK